MRIAVRARPKDGEENSGDGSVILETPAQTVIVVLDALGHGDAAAAVAAQGIAAVRKKSFVDPVDTMRELHAALRGTRGAAALVCAVSSNALRAVSVGNIELRTHRFRFPLVATPGILGWRHQTLLPSEAPLPSPARIALFSDGVSPHLDLAAVSELDLERAADALFAAHAGSADDATLVLVEV